MPVDVHNENWKFLGNETSHTKPVDEVGLHEQSKSTRTEELFVHVLDKALFLPLKVVNNTANLPHAQFHKTQPAMTQSIVNAHNQQSVFSSPLKPTVCPKF